VLGGAVLSPDSLFGPDPAGALEITEDGDYVVAEVVDPRADVETYAAELAEYGLDVRLDLLPTLDPALANTLLGGSWEGRPEGEPQVDIAPADCNADPADRSGCPTVIRIPRDQPGTVEIYVYRAAEPGEVWDATHVPADPEDIGLIDEGVLEGGTVADARRLLDATGVSADFYAGHPDEETGEVHIVSDSRLDPAEIPGDQYVAAVTYRHHTGHVDLAVTPDPPHEVEDWRFNGMIVGQADG
jgi:hypothetical protein